jgi:hypothetical protein
MIEIRDHDRMDIVAQADSEDGSNNIFGFFVASNDIGLDIEGSGHL